MIPKRMSTYYMATEDLHYTSLFTYENELILESTTNTNMWLIYTISATHTQICYAIEEKN